MTNADLIHDYLKTRQLQADAKQFLDTEKEQLQPWQDNFNAAKQAHAEAKTALTELLGEPGAKITTDSGTASLSKPKTTTVLELDTDELIQHLQVHQPKLLERFTKQVEKTPAPRLTVKEK